MKFDTKFWVHTATSVGIVLLGLFIYDKIRPRMAGSTSNAMGTFTSKKTDRVRCTNPNSPMTYGASGDPCCTGTQPCSYDSDGKIMMSAQSVDKILARKRR